MRTRAPTMLGGGLALAASAASFVFTTRTGKFALWRRVLDGLHLRGDERVLDIGCGRGAVTTMAARLVPTGWVAGVDLWHAADQSGNRAETTRRNAALEGVDGRVALQTADMTDLPFPAGAFDVVVSSLAMHNLQTAAGRSQAVDEAVRVLRPGGRLAIVDIKSTGEYAARLGELGMGGVTRTRLGWRGWYGGPWMASCAVHATKPD
jgi:arsenite methyltransferase